MAIAKMKRFRILTLKDGAEDLADELQSLRCADIERAETGEGDAGLDFYDTSKKAAEIKSRMSETAAALDFLALYEKKSRGLFKPPRDVRRSSSSLPGPGEGEYGTVSRALALRDERTRLYAELTSLKNEAEALAPWASLDAPVPRFRTDSAVFAAGSVSSKISVSKLMDALEGRAAEIVTIRETPEYRFILLAAYRTDFDDAFSELQKAGFSPAAVEAGESDGFAAGKLAAVKERIDGLKNRIAEIDSETEELTKQSEKLELLYDLLSTEEEKQRALSNFSVSERCAILSGWIPDAAVESVTALLERRGDAYEFSDPAEDDDVPVLLSNNRFTKSFEPVIELYSLPKYGSFDPTSIMSIFYIIIFGLMLADVGYGVLISIACFLGVRLLKPKQSTKNMLLMFGKCGISCIIAGVLFGGYFGDAPSVIMKNWFGNASVGDLAAWFNPLTNFTSFLAVSLAIGAAHLVTGLCLKFYILWMRGHRLDAVFDAGSWIILFVGAAIALFFRTVGLVLVGIGLLMLITTQGRHNKNPLMKVFGGLVSLYDIVGYISDLLSYSRILALGLASAVVASVFNILSTMAGPSFIGVALFIVIFLIGHLLNLAINLLGTFVHTSRLQYIEFFGKFYEDGGRPFEPLTPKSKYVNFI